MTHYDYCDQGYGVTLTDGVKTVFLQGDDADGFLDEVNDLDDVWLNGNPNTDIFKCYEDHLDLLIDPYFGDDDGDN